MNTLMSAVLSALVLFDFEDEAVRKKYPGCVEKYAVGGDWSHCVGDRWLLIRPKENAVAVGKTVGEETLVRLPSLSAFGVAAVVPGPFARGRSKCTH